LEQLFYPQSVAVIGVSESPDNLARVIVENLLEFHFQGKILLVGKQEGRLHGKRIVTSLDDLKEGIDVAVILTPAPTVPGLLESCGRKKIPWVVLETGGFSEYSKEGARLEKELLAIARKWGIRMVGPNGLGVINMENGFVVPFVGMTRKPMHPGKVSILAQSGGISFTYLNLLSSASVGISKVVSMGNKLDLDEIDYLKYLIRDPKTEIIGLYLESIKRGRELMEIARTTSKPILLHKSNIGEGSRQIARLHTAALANDDRIVETALKQSNIIRARDFRSFVSGAKAFSLPVMRGDRLVVISRSGGLAIIAADSAEIHGFRLYPFTENFQKQIHGYFRAKVIQPTNPLDLGDLFNFDLYIKILEQVLRVKAVDGILFQHGAIGEEEEPSRRLIQKVKELSFHYQKPIALCYITSEEELTFVRKTIDYPIFEEPSDALSALAMSRDRFLRRKVPIETVASREVNQSLVKELFQKAREEGRDPFLPEALEVLKAYGITVADYQVIHEKKELGKAIAQMGKPVALKVISSEISHKSDKGGVILNVTDPAQAGRAFEKIKRAGGKRFSGILIQKMVTDGMEVILGAKRDPSFGPVVLFGLGGIYVELLKETSLRVAPINRSEAEEMISELKASAILRGARGRKPLDTQALVENLLRLSQLMVDFPEIEGIDINPVIVQEKGAVAVDARISLAESSAQSIEHGA
jgi:acyl-CoA synthetase (NDP forming)